MKKAEKNREVHKGSGEWWQEGTWVQARQWQPACDTRLCAGAQSSEVQLVE